MKYCWWRMFGEKGSRGLGGLQIIIRKWNQWSICHREPSDRVDSKMEKFGVLGAEKRGKTLAGYDLDKEFIKENVGGNILFV